MLLALLVMLNTSSVCVELTDICAPPGSTMQGSIAQSGGQVTITPSQPMRALGAEFRAGTNVTVTVLPWGGSDKTRGAVVHVRGELTHEMQISGARVAGIVRIGQLQGRKSSPQLVEATDLKGGKLIVSTAGSVDVGPAMQLVGNVDIGGVTVEVTSPQSIHALGLEFAAGTVRIHRATTETTFSGTLARPQEIGGVLVEKAVDATLTTQLTRFTSATLARATPLRLLGLPDGEAPAGTRVLAGFQATQLVGPGPFTVCGVSLVPQASQGQSLVTFTPSGPPAHVVVNGTLAARDVDLGSGLRMSGAITLRYAPQGCQRLGIEGTLARPAEQHGLHFAANAAFASDESAQGDVVLRGTLAQHETVDGLELDGAISVRVPNAGGPRLLDGTLAKAAPFEQWRLPVGSHVQRFDGGWAFTAPRGQDARATAVHRGERVDHVIEARSDDRMTSFTLKRPHTPAGTKLALDDIGIDHATGCVVGDVSTAQHIGMFSIPTGGDVTLCAGRVIETDGMYAVPSLQVGRWFATRAVAGDPTAPPTQERVSRASSPATAPASPPTGYWIQINSLCQGHAGIPLPPPEERWIWVDAKGQPASASDRNELVSRASKRGKACPITPCCPP